ncbi:hypothetical protein [Blastopirellula marina]|uniref:DoxX family protein n=1 Tax=Blastopirellula marina TaxID=124 RepID=A0A2S8G9E3_9BACT|nr:hypothetical protein [Blastopirellula marina]PQO40920.1 hypothetical protein C5Y98_04900 [Blastopirellula marina]PTL45802.1 hypothetical protein C5Y97_04900 [Blastopirellula marina]
MNILLWILQAILALHTVMGAVWKFSHSAEQTMPSLKAIPQPIWLGMSGLEIVVAVCLVLPAIYKPAGVLVSIAALVIVAEMVLFTGLYFAAGATNIGPVIYWLIVAAICGFIAYGRFALSPL